METLTKSSPEPGFKLEIQPAESVKVGTPIRIVANVTSSNIAWHVDPPSDGFGLLPADWSDNATLLAEPSRVGSYNVTAVAADATGKLSWAKATITVTNGGSELSWMISRIGGFGFRLLGFFRGNIFPYLLMLLLGAGIGYSTHSGCHLPPIPWPTPGPGPWPTPTPNPSVPIKVDTIHVMMVKNQKPLPQAQTDILTSGAIRDYLRSKGSDAIRVYNEADDLTNEEQVWKDIYARPRASLPWIAIYTAKGFHEGPLPADVQSTLDLVKKYGDQ